MKVEESATAVAASDEAATPLAGQADIYKALPSDALSALKSAEEVLEALVYPAKVDPMYGRLIAEWGDRVGFGALMSSASASWRESLLRSGYSAGGEFSVGPCVASAKAVLDKVRAALTDAALSPAWLPIELERDKARLDWLETHVVNVRVPLVYGSRDLFWATPDRSFEGEEGPSDIRAKIDAALPLPPPPASCGERI